GHNDGSIDLFHQAMVLNRPLEGHFGWRPLAYRSNEVPIHGLVAPDVAEPGKDQTRRPVAACEHETAVRFERDDAVPSRDRGEPQPAKQGWDLARIVQRANRAVIVLKGHHHTFGATIAAVSRDRWTMPLDSGDLRPQTARQV